MRDVWSTADVERSAAERSAPDVWDYIAGGTTWFQLYWLRAEFETALRLAGCPDVASARHLTVAESPAFTARESYVQST